jgi:hypothetical protein
LWVLPVKKKILDTNWKSQLVLGSSLESTHIKSYVDTSHFYCFSL